MELIPWYKTELIGRFKRANGVGVSIGGGFQLATTQLYRNNYNGIFTIRFPFKEL